MATVITPAPTYADVVLVDPATQKGKFNPIWLKWFLDLSAQVNVGVGTVTHTGGDLTANALVLGAGGADIAALGSLGTTAQVLHGNAAGAPTWGAVSLTADVSGILPVANGGSGSATLGSTDTQVLFNDSGAMAGDAGLVFNKTTNALTVTGGLTNSTLTAGRVIFAGTAGLLSDDANFLFNSTSGVLSLTKQYAGQSGLVIQNTLSDFDAKAAFLVQSEAGYVSFNVVSSTGGQTGKATLASTATGGLDIQTQGAYALALGTNFVDRLTISSTGTVTTNLLHRVKGASTAAGLGVSYNATNYGTGGIVYFGATDHGTGPNAVISRADGTYRMELRNIGPVTVPSSAAVDWIDDGTGSAFVPNTVSISKLAVSGESSAYPIAGIFGTKTSLMDSGGVGGRMLYALGVIGNNDSTSYAQFNYALYTESYLASGAPAGATSQGIEAAMLNRKALVKADPFNPNADVGLAGGGAATGVLGLTEAFRAGAGKAGGNQTVSTGYSVISVDGTQFNVGLLFHNTAIATGGDAIALGAAHTISWFSAANTKAVTITNSGGALTVSTGRFHVANTTAATSTTTGSITTPGGLGIGKDSYFGQSLYATGALIAGTDVTATNYVNGSNATITNTVSAATFTASSGVGTPALTLSGYVVSAGANDSGGAGYRLLRITN